MARLVYTDKAGNEQTMHLHGEDVTIGRHPTCSIQTTNASVSRRHCVIRSTPDGYELTDQNSSSGTYINQHRITRHILSDTEEIYCGSFVLTFHADARAAQTTQKGKLVYYDDANVECTVPLDEEHPRVTVGRSADCTVRTNDTSVSRMHSEFLYTNGNFEVADLDSFNGTYVNDQQILREGIKPDDRISCGRLTFLFYVEEVPAASPAPPRPLPPEVPVAAPAPRRNPAPPSPPPSPRRSQAVPAVPSTPRRPSPPPFEGPLSGSMESHRSDNRFKSRDDNPRFHEPDRSMDHSVDRRSSRETPRVDDKRLQDAEADLARLRDEVSDLRSQNRDLQREVDGSRDRGQDDRDRVRQLEKELDRRQFDLDTLREKCTDLKEQCARYSDQLDQKRQELQEHKDSHEELRYKFDEVQQQHDRGNNKVTHYIEENAELKAQITQLQRKTDEAERQNNTQAYDLKKAHQELEELRAFVNREGASNNHLQSDIDKLRLVLEEKESALRNRDVEIDNLRHDLQEVDKHQENARTLEERLRNEVDYYRDQLREQEDRLSSMEKELNEAHRASSDNREVLDLRTRLERLQNEYEDLQDQARQNDERSSRGNNASQVNDLKRTNRDQRYKIEELEKALEQAQRNGGGSSSSRSSLQSVRLHEENEDLKERLVDLEQKLKSARNRAPENNSSPDLERLQRDKRIMEREIQDLRRELENASRRPSNPSGGGNDQLRSRARETYDLLNDSVSQFKRDMKAARGYVEDIRRVQDTFRRIDLKNLSTLERARIEDMLQEIDPDFTFEDLTNLIKDCVENTEGMKDALLQFRRDVLR